MSDVWQACAVCAWPLVRVTGGGAALGWVHHTAEVDDHTPIPVDAGDVQVNQRCDFCSTIPATHALITTEFAIPRPPYVPPDAPPLWSRGWWVACADCFALIERHRWTALISRVRKVLKASPEPQTRHMAMVCDRAHYEAMYARVQAHMTGVVPIEVWIERMKTWETTVRPPT